MLEPREHGTIENPLKKEPLRVTEEILKMVSKISHLLLSLNFLTPLSSTFSLIPCTPDSLISLLIPTDINPTTGLEPRSLPRELFIICLNVLFPHLFGNDFLTVLSKISMLPDTLFLSSLLDFSLSNYHQITHSIFFIHLLSNISPLTRI